MAETDNERAEYFFELLLQAAASDTAAQCYSRMSQAYSLMLQRATEHAQAQLIGPFAKTDYLLKNNGASPRLRYQVNTARVHLRHAGDMTMTAEEMEALWSKDYEALCRFVALVFHSEVDSRCMAYFDNEQEEVHEERRERVADYLRVIVNRWDAERIYADCPEMTDEEITIRYAGRDLNSFHYDWSALQPLLEVGCQLNIVHPVRQGDEIYPELIIYEPDYLVDITSVANCFEEYGPTELIHLMKKISPMQCTSAILLGNLMGELLDAEMYDDDNTNAYNDTVRRFYKKNVANLLSTETDADFHDKAKRQMMNIRQAVNVKLPHDIERYKKSEVMLEPSFFSEMLGLQGRMDFLQLDHEVLIEQKSGKCGFPQRSPQVPEKKETHYVQTLLYMALLRYNYSEQYLRNNREGRGLQAYIMYSNYEESLYSAAYAPDMVFAALMIRNRIVWREKRYAEGGFDILTRLEADSLNVGGTTSRLWQGFQRPQIEALLLPVKLSTPLERAYYMRMMTFVAKEHLLSKVGNRRKMCSGFAATWNEPLKDKLAAGNIYYNLSLVSPAMGDEGTVDDVVLHYSDDEAYDMANFRKGDIVILYPYNVGEVPDARRTMVFRGTLRSVDDGEISIHLRATQGSTMPLLKYASHPWAMEHDFLESSYSGLYRGLQEFLTAPKHRRDLLLMQREPCCDESRALKGDYGTFNELALRVKQAKDFFLIIGPPGTGKTTHGMVSTLSEELKSNAEGNILLMAYTNRAVDEICDKLIEQGLDFVRLGNELSCSPQSVPYLLDRMVESCDNKKALTEAFAKKRIVVSTTTSMTSNTSLFTIKHFSLAIIDEASQLLEPHLLPILSAHTYEQVAIEKFVMIGDHKQLPAVVQQGIDESMVKEPLLKGIGLTNCRLSLFERLLRRYQDNPHIVYMLSHQGRMHSEVADFPNRVFYGGHLSAVPLNHQTQPIATVATGDNLSDFVMNRRFSFVDVLPYDDVVSEQVNQHEAEVIAHIAVAIYRLESSSFESDRTLGIIVPYRNQIATIRKLLNETGIHALNDITIDTVERYQGSQRDWIIYGLTVQRRHQLHFLTETAFEEDSAVIDRKMNVALTRARLHQIVVGNASLVSKDRVYNQLIDYCKEHSSYMSVAE